MASFVHAGMHECVFIRPRDNSSGSLQSISVLVQIIQCIATPMPHMAAHGPGPGFTEEGRGTIFMDSSAGIQEQLAAFCFISSALQAYLLSACCFGLTFLLRHVNCI
jgi:hypothetical protein|mmetsp:Transcript_17668/g.30561  ORF Transcript_17668/g.30561 Transcript_17668/m.30561 type:complete len:107 (-) Transcript_17668:650-970(-)